MLRSQHIEMIRKEAFENPSLLHHRYVTPESIKEGFFFFSQTFRADIPVLEHLMNLQIQLPTLNKFFQSVAKLAPGKLMTTPRYDLCSSELHVDTLEYLLIW